MKDTTSKGLLVGLLAVAVLAGGTPAWAQEAAADDDPGLDLYYSANSLCSRRFYKLAVAEYTLFLEKFPTHAKVPKAKWGLALALYSMGDLKQAEPLLAKLAGGTTIKAQDQLHNLWGTCLLAMDRLAEAEKAFAWTIDNAKDPKDKHVSNARVGHIEALFLQSKWADVIVASDAMLKIAPDSPRVPNARYQGAVARMRLKQYEPAVAVFKAMADGKADADLTHRAVFQQAECMRLTDKLAEAAPLYEAAAKTTKGLYSELAHYNLGLVQFTLDKYVASAQELAAFIKAYPKSQMRDQARLYLGRAYLESPDYGRAATTLGELSKGGPLAGQATLWYARTYARQKKWDIVVRNLTKSLQKLGADPAAAGMLYELATAQMRMGKHAQAAAAYAQAFAKTQDPVQRGEFLRMQAFCLYRGGKYAESIALCQQFAKDFAADPKAADVIFFHAENLMLLKKGPEALPYYSKLLTVAPKHRHADLARFRRAQILMAQSKYALAATDLEAVLAGVQTAKVFEEVRFLAAECYFHLAQWDKATPAYEKFIEEKPAAPNVDRAMYNLGLAYQRQTTPSTEKAIEILTELIEVEYGRKIPGGGGKPPRGRKGRKGGPRHHDKQPQLQPARVELGRLLYEAENYPRAKAVLLEAVKTYRETRTEGNGNAEYYLAWIAMKANNNAEAAKYFDILKKYPNHSFASDSSLQTAILQIRTGRIPEAQKTIEKVLAADPKHVKADQLTYYLGLCKARQNKYSDAIEQFKKVLATFPKSDKADNALFWRAQCEERHLKDKGPATAIATYKTFLTQFGDSEMLGDAMVELSRLELDAGLNEVISKRLAALTAAESTVTLSPQLRSQALYVLGWAEFRLKKWAPSAEAFEAMTAMGKVKGATLASAYFQAGESRRKLKEYEQAYVHFRKAVQVGKETPSHEPAMLRQSECEALTSRWRESQRTAQEFLKLYAKSKLVPQARYQYGWAMQNQKQYAQAITEYRQVVAGRARDENAARAQFQLGECLLLMNKLDDAVKELIRVESKYDFAKWKSKALVEIGRVAEMQKRPHHAIARYKEVIKRYPETSAAAVAKTLLSKLQ